MKAAICSVGVPYGSPGNTRARLRPSRGLRRECARMAGAFAAGMEGGSALLRPGWLVFGQLLSAPLMAALLPLATAGYSVCYEELRLRAATPVSA